MSQPKIQVPRSQSDLLLEAAGGLLALLLPLTVWYYYPQLPDQIPTHFGASGQPDATGSKTSLWMVVLIGLTLYGTMTALARYPHLFNYPKPVTEENAPRSYRTMISLMRWLKLVIAALFLYLTVGNIRVAQGLDAGLNMAVFVCFLLALGILLTYFLRRFYREY